MAERVGVEPTVIIADYTAFRVRPDRPLWHLSVGDYSKPGPGNQAYRADLCLGAN